jgi:hypothetical protein
MTKKPNNLTPRKLGQPTTYRDTFPALAKTFSMECGGTGKQLADLFHVSERTIKNWLTQYPEFKAAVQAGRDYFNTGTAEQCLLKRVMGYDYVEVTSEISKLTGKMIETKRVTKHIPPSDVALFYFLGNRAKFRWENTQKMEHSGPKGGPIPMQVVDFANIPPLKVGIEVSVDT